MESQKFTAYNKLTGEVLYSGVSFSPEVLETEEVGIDVNIELASDHYKVGGDYIQKPQQPSPHHDWDWPTKSWLPNLDAAKAAKKAETEAELARRLYLPCNGFDADPLSRERISGMIARLQRGDGLPAGWVGWRDFSNQQQWAADDAATVLANLTVLSRAIEDREQGLLISAWQHKKNIDDLAQAGDISALTNYNTAQGWAF